MLGKLDSNMQKKETRPLSHTKHKNKSWKKKKKFQTDERPRCKTGNHQNPRGEHSSNPSDINCSNLLDRSLEARETKAKMNYWDFIKTRVLHSEGNNP